MRESSNELVLPQNNADEAPFFLEELTWSLKTCKNDKQPGPDELQMELLKWLNNEPGIFTEYDKFLVVSWGGPGRTL